MNTTRQDAWTKDEDLLLAETVLRYIREGKTQLEAFKEVAKQLSRTSAACGFRWNATIRKQYQYAIESAKLARKEANQPNSINHAEPENKQEQDSDPLDTAILLLKKIKIASSDQGTDIQEENKELKQLEEENRLLKEQLNRFDNAWQEMGKLWNWVKDKEQ